MSLLWKRLPIAVKSMTIGCSVMGTFVAIGKGFLSVQIMLKENDNDISIAYSSVLFGALASLFAQFPSVWENEHISNFCNREIEKEACSFCKLETYSREISKLQRWHRRSWKQTRKPSTRSCSHRGSEITHCSCRNGFSPQNLNSQRKRKHSQFCETTSRFSHKKF